MASGSRGLARARRRIARRLWPPGGRRGALAAGPVAVEILGTAGAGKSTLSAALLAADPAYRRGPFIRTRRPADLARLVATLPRLAPLLVVNAVRPPRLSWADVKLMAYVTGWHRTLRRHASPDHVVVFDQGPVYALVRLRAQGRGVGATPRFDAWWHAMLRRWARELTVVVVLDAPDDVLRDRIDGRGQAHVVKGAGGDVGRRFLARYRRLFDEVLRHFERGGAPVTARFDTGERSVRALVGDVRALVDRHRDPDRAVLEPSDARDEP